MTTPHDRPVKDGDVAAWAFIWDDRGSASYEPVGYAVKGLDGWHAVLTITGVARRESGPYGTPFHATAAVRVAAQAETGV